MLILELIRSQTKSMPNLTGISLTNIVKFLVRPHAISLQAIQKLIEFPTTRKFLPRSQKFDSIERRADHEPI